MRIAIRNSSSCTSPRAKTASHLLSGALAVMIAAAPVRADEPALPTPGGASTSPAPVGYVAPAKAAAPAPFRPRIAVAGFVAPGVPDDVVAGLESACATEVSRLVNADVISAEDMRMLLNVSVYQSSVGCESGDCVQSLGDALAVQQLVSGGVRKSGAKYTLSLSRLDAVNARVLQRTTVEVASADELLRAVRQATPALFGVIGKLEVWDQPAGAEVILDGARIGTTPMSVIDVKSPGKHTIEIVGPTVTPWRASFEIGAGQDVKLRAHNRPIDELEAESGAWTWAGAGLVTGGVVAGATSGALYFLALRNDQRADSVTLRAATQDELNAIADVSLGYTIGAIATGVVAAVGIAGGAGALLFNPAAAELDAALE